MKVYVDEQSGRQFGRGRVYTNKKYNTKYLSITFDSVAKDGKVQHLKYVVKIEGDFFEATLQRNDNESDIGVIKNVYNPPPKVVGSNHQGVDRPSGSTLEGSGNSGKIS